LNTVPEVKDAPVSIELAAALFKHKHSPPWPNAAALIELLVSNAERQHNVSFVNRVTVEPKG